MNFVTAYIADGWPFLMVENFDESHVMAMRATREHAHSTVDVEVYTADTLDEAWQEINARYGVLSPEASECFTTSLP